MGVIVQKYGGSSLATTERIRKVARRIIETKKKGNQVVAIVSAMGDSTDELIALAKEISDRPPKREMDMLLSTGEQVSISLLAMAIESMGEDVISLTGQQAGIRTDDMYSKARIVNIVSTRLEQEIKDKSIVIVAGFQGINANDDITTLGRGGSDTTAVAIAAAVKAKVCEIYTDVDGVYAGDPRIIKGVKKLDVISYDEMLELATLGAAVLHPRSVEVAKIHGVTIHVRSSFTDTTGTLVQEVGDMEKEIIVTGIAHDMDVVKMAIFGVPDEPGVAYLIFDELAKAHINVQMIVQSAEKKGVNDIAFTVPKSDKEEALEIITRFKEKVGANAVIMKDGLARLSIVGAGMITNPTAAARMFMVLSKAGINLEMISTSDIKVSVIIDAKRCVEAAEIVAKEFDLVEEN